MYTQNSERYKWVDIAKGIGIILVVFGHSLRGMDLAGVTSPSNPLLYCYPIIYSFHMPLFFILSGLFFTKGIQKYGTGDFLKNKIRTILYPFVIWSVIQTTIEIYLSHYNNGNLPLSSLITCLYTPRIQFWFLFSLFFINIINALLHSVNSKIYLYISFGLTIVFEILHLSANFNLTPFNATLYHLLYFNIGIIIVNYIFREDVLNWVRKYFIVIVLLFVTCEYLYIMNYIDIAKVFFSWLLLPTIGSLLIISCSFKLADTRIALYLSNIGRLSLEIYILHIICGWGIRITLHKVLGIEDKIIQMIVVSIGGVLLPYLFVKYLNRFPLSEYLFRIPARAITKTS